jgi:hypothetical protein
LIFSNFSFSLKKPSIAHCHCQSDVSLHLKNKDMKAEDKAFKQWKANWSILGKDLGYPIWITLQI